MVLVALFGKYVTMFFIPADKLVHQIGHTMFFIIAPSVVFFGISTILNGAFQGSGFTIPVMIVNLARIWIFRIPLVYWISYVLLKGPQDIDSSIGIWLGMFFSNFFAFLMIFIWYLKGNWKKSRIKTIPAQGS
jgi:Na+-driven multidrug efflux pump